MLKCMCLEATSHGLRRPKNKVSLLEEAEKNLQSQHEGKGVSWSAFPWLQAGGCAASPGVTVGHGEETRRLGSAGVELSCRLRAFPAFSLLHPSQPAGLYLSPHSLSTILCSCPGVLGGGRGGACLAVLKQSSHWQMVQMVALGTQLLTPAGAHGCHAAL